MKKEIKSAWSTGQSTTEAIKDLKAKIALREKDDSSFLCTAKEIITDIDIKRTFLKNDISKKRRDLAKCLNGDKEVIITALHGSPVDQLTYQRCTADKCIAEKNQDVYDQVKKINSLKHIMNQKQQKIDELNLTLKNLRHQENRKAQQSSVPNSNGQNSVSCSTDDESDQRIRILSTKLDKILLKINSARYVNTTYKRLLAYLEKDSLSLPGRLDNLECNLEEQKKELVDLRKTAQEAKHACENTRKQRSILENEIMSSKSIRDKKLTSIKRKLREIQDEAEKNLNLAPFMGNNNNSQRKRDHRGKNTNGSDSSMRMSGFNNDRKLQKDALSAALHILKDTVGASKVEDIATNFESQLQTQTNLLTEAEQLQKNREELVIRLRNEEESLTLSTYDASLALEGSNNTDELLSQDKGCLRSAKNITNQLSMMEMNIRTITDAINVYYRKACILKNIKCVEDMSYDNKMKLITDQFGNLARRNQTNLFSYSNVDMTSENTPDEKIQFDLLVPEENKRVTLPDHLDDVALANSGQNGNAERTTEKQSLFNDEDEELEGSYFSRDEIKKRGIELINQARPKKGKKGR
jgi:hypothetical protein